MKKSVPKKGSGPRSDRSRDTDLLFEVGTLRHANRAWAQVFGGHKTATILEHTARVSILALIIARRETEAGRATGLDEGKILAMALLHDLPESRTVDHAHVHKAYVKEDEHLALLHMFEGTSLASLAQGSAALYKERACLEAKIVKDADNLDIDLELRELANAGSTLPSKWTGHRRIVRTEKLYTEAARQLWDEIQQGDPDEWHVVANKWLASGKGNGR